jgi:hypothetical protein
MSGLVVSHFTPVSAALLHTQYSILKVRKTG